MTIFDLIYAAPRDAVLGSVAILLFMIGVADRVLARRWSR